MTPTVPIPFFQGSLDQVKELQALCSQRGFRVDPIKPPGGCGNS